MMEKALLLSAAILAFAGCGVESESDKASLNKANETDAEWDKLPSSAVIVSVNESSFTKEQILRACELNDALMTVCFDALKIDSARQQKAREKADMDFRQQLIAKYIIRNSVLTAEPAHEATAEGLEKVRKELEKGITSGKWSYAQIRDCLKRRGLAKDLEKRIDEEARFVDIITRQQATNHVYTLKEAEELRTKRQKINEQLKVVNEKLYQKASNSVARVQKGEAMEALAKEYFKNERFGRVQEMPGVTAEDFTEEGEKLEWRAMEPLPIGGVSGVTVLEDGIAIYKRLPDSAPDEDGVCTRNYRKLVFRRACLLDDHEADVLQKMMNEEAAEDSLKAIYANAVKKAEIKFPSGRNFIPFQTYSILKQFRNLEETNDEDTGKK